jgi:hypothetical protein
MPISFLELNQNMNDICLYPSVSADGNIYSFDNFIRYGLDYFITLEEETKGGYVDLEALPEPSIVPTRMVTSKKYNLEESHMSKFLEIQGFHLHSATDLDEYTYGEECDAHTHVRRKHILFVPFEREDNPIRRFHNVSDNILIINLKSVSISLEGQKYISVYGSSDTLDIHSDPLRRAKSVHMIIACEEVNFFGFVPERFDVNSRTPMKLKFMKSLPEEALLSL